MNLAKVMRTPLNPAAAADPTYPLWSNGANYGANEAAYISRPPLVWTGVPTPLYTLGTPQAHARFGGLNTAYNQVGQPDRVYRSYPNEVTVPPAINMPAPGTAAHFYSQVDFDGRTATSILPLQPKYHELASGRHTNLIFGTGFIGTPGMAGDPPRPHPDSRYGNGMFIPTATPPYEERMAHPSMYSPYYVRSHRAKDLNLATDRAFNVEEMRLLNEKFYHGPREKFVGSDLALLAPQTLGNPRPPVGQVNPHSGSRR